MSASPDGGDTSVLVFFLGQRNYGIRSQTSDDARKRLTGLRNRRPGFEQDQVNYKGGVLRQFEGRGPGEVSTAGKGSQLTEILCGKFTLSKI